MKINKTVHIAITNQKGGAGKTTTANSIAILLSETFNKKVCLIDCDQQANTTKMFVQGREIEEAKQLTDSIIEYDGKFSNNILTLSHLLTNKEQDVFKIIHPTKYPNLNIIASSLELNIAIKHISSSAKHLKSKLNNLNGAYDFIIYDCAPSTDVLLSNILAASDLVLIPIQPEQQSIDGMNQTIKFINETQHLENHSLNFKVFLTMLDKRLKMHREFVDDFARVDFNAKAIVFNTLNGKHRLKTSIRRQTAPVEKSANNNEVTHFTLLTGTKRPGVAEDYYMLVEELLKEVE